MNLVSGPGSDILKHGYPASAVAATSAQIIKHTSGSRAGPRDCSERDDCSESALGRRSHLLPRVQIPELPRPQPLLPEAFRPALARAERPD